MEHFRNILSIILVALILISSTGVSYVSHCNHCPTDIELKETACCLTNKHKEEAPEEKHSCCSSEAEPLACTIPPKEIITESCGALDSGCCYETVVTYTIPFRNNVESLQISTPSFALHYIIYDQLFAWSELDTSSPIPLHDTFPLLSGRDIQTHFCTYLI